MRRKTQIPRTEEPDGRGIQVRRIDPTSPEGLEVLASIQREEERRLQRESQAKQIRSKAMRQKPVFSSWQKERKAPGQIEHNKRLLDEDKKRKEMNQIQSSLEEFKTYTASQFENLTRELTALRMALEEERTPPQPVVEDNLEDRLPEYPDTPSQTELSILKKDERFWNELELNTGSTRDGSCWLWGGALNFQSHIEGFRRNYHPRKYAYLLANGPFEGTLKAVCGEATCCNPNHAVIYRKGMMPLLKAAQEIAIKGKSAEDFQGKFSAEDFKEVLRMVTGLQSD